jgi:methionine synthase I (cobalamin-dependent)
VISGPQEAVPPRAVRSPSCGARPASQTASSASLSVAELAGWYTQLRSILPDLRVVGGCCGTDHEHVTAIAESLTGVRS